MRREDARVHAFVWAAVSVKMLPRASTSNETARLMRILSALAGEVGRAYAAVSESKHPITGEALEAE